MATEFITGYELSGSSKIKRESSLIPDVSASGVMRFVDLGAAVYYVITAVFECLSEAESTALHEWLDTNEKEEIDLTFDQTVYRGYISPSADITIDPDAKNPNLYALSFVFRGVRQ